MPHLACITVFPIKALNGVRLLEATVVPSGGLRHDRRFALFDSDGNFINGKRNAKVHLLRVTYEPDLQTVSVRIQGENPAQRFRLIEDRASLEEWLSNFFGCPVQVQENQDTGFADDLDAPGPTVISTATLETVASWFPPLTADEMRDRFRANLEIGGVEPFWEDRLFGEKGQAVRFEIGGVLFEGINPCQRCVVPSRNPQSAEAIPSFQKTFAQRRKASLPAWATTSRFDHFYRLAVNTRVVQSQGSPTLRAGDEIRLLETP